MAAVPVTEAEANDREFSGIFKKKRKKITDKVPLRQAEVEQRWDTFAREVSTIPDHRICAKRIR